MAEQVQEGLKSFSLMTPPLNNVLCRTSGLKAFSSFAFFTTSKANGQKLWDSKNRINEEDRAQLILLIRDLVFAKDDEKLSINYQSLLKSTVAVKYSKFIEIVKSSWERTEWALCYRQHLVTRGNHTNNYAEAGMRIVKEQVFSRVKAFNLVQMFHFITDTLDSYYCRHLLSTAHNRLDRHIAKRFQRLRAKSVPVELISCIGLNQYEVQSCSEEKTTYTVDTAIGICSCPS